MAEDEPEWDAPEEEYEEETEELQEEFDLHAASSFDDDEMLSGLDAVSLNMTAADIRQAALEYEREISSWRQQEQTPSSVAISAKLIADRCLGRSEGPVADDDDYLEKLLELHHIDLEGCHITQIDNLDCFTQTTHLFLQQNRIKKIENLEFLRDLKVLVLAHNEITTIDGISNLPFLQVLDVSFNVIEECFAEDLPRQLQYLYLEGNPVLSGTTTDPATLVLRLMRGIPSLLAIDGRRIGNMLRLRNAAPVNPSIFADDIEDGDDMVAPEPPRPWQVPTVNNEAGERSRPGTTAGSPTQVASNNSNNPSTPPPTKPKPPAVSSTALAASRSPRRPPGSAGISPMRGPAISAARKKQREIGTSSPTSDDPNEQDANGDANGEEEDTVAEAESEADIDEALDLDVKASDMALRQAIAVFEESARAQRAHYDALLEEDTTDQLVAAPSEALDMSTSGRQRKVDAEALNRIARHRGSVGTVALQDDFDAALMRMRANQQARLGRSRDRRAQLGEVYAVRSRALAQQRESGSATRATLNSIFLRTG
eukprot:TRINITY_DN68471_c0_g1_i1.p1 TRINITY_DN68471_c0_g1~~TRINITY_DN68471_c0_g1_i1.p1  ORF type:complete len:542 (+),score=116.44 TRINITY_DN68471_c0_g1_i1:26-1651(+)